MEPLRRSALVDATIYEIGARGSLDVTVSQIARRAGVSSALAHHYFGSKEQIFSATMRHILQLYGAQVRGALVMARTPRQRVEAIVRASFSSMSQRPEIIAAWMNFYVQAQKTPGTARLLAIYQCRLHSNLYHGFRRIAPDRAMVLTQGVAAMIDGLYCRQVLRTGPQVSEDAVNTLLHYISLALNEATQE
ncbi:transcriptional regulator BetI [Pseudohalocynthiibacter aestuariivivens]|nr:transcriptional regulator BetI [Pseudohalocynthiibacter aestuariivivens]QIE47661.1 transcriptional regulator BetI [Pseudohalocynthiibacter aestuariivivens]